MVRLLTGFRQGCEGFGVFFGVSVLRWRGGGEWVGGLVAADARQIQGACVGKKHGGDVVLGCGFGRLWC